MTVHVDGLDLEDEEEATRLMVHHLRLAASLFEATRDDKGRRAIEMLRGLPDVVAEAGSVFVAALCVCYERMSLEDEGADND